jgi:hypothetical protein
MEKIKNSKWYSKKLFVALIGVLIIVLNDVLGLGIDSDTVWQFASVIGVYLFGQSAVDVQKHKKSE